MKTINITTVGDGATGKANLLMAFKHPDFQYVYQEYISCMFQFFTRELLIDGEKIAVVMQHTQGQEEFARLRKIVYPLTDVCLILFSVVSPVSFENIVKTWLPEVNHHLPTIPCLLVGTKSELRDNATIIEELVRSRQRPVTLNEIHQLCKTYKMPYFETSAHTGFGVEECFYEAVRTAFKFKYAKKIPHPTIDTLRRFIVDKLVPAPIHDNVSFGMSLGFDGKTIKLHNKACSIEHLRWQLLKFFIETVDEMKTFPYRFIYKALRKCKQVSLAEELVECLNQDQDLMSVKLDGKIVHKKVDEKIKIALKERLASFSFCVEDQTPQSIWKMGSQAHSLYMEILKSGTERRYIIRIMIVGPFGVGKTCLLRRLLKKDIHDVISTNGIDIFRCKVQLNNGRWIFDDDLYFDEGKEGKSRLLRQVVTSQEYNRTEVDTAKESSKTCINRTSVDFSSKLFSDSAEVKKASQDTIAPLICSKQYQSVVQKTKSKPNTVQSPHKDLLDDFQGIHDSDVSYEDLAEVRILDFAGQYEFYATHQPFLNKNAIYLLALDMSKDLKGILTPDDLDEGFKDITEIPFEDIGEYVIFWLDSIHCYAENVEEEQSKYSLPPVVVVGTCSDKLNDKKKRQVEIQDQLGQLLDDHPKGKHIRDFIFLSNTTSTESEYDLLRDKIVKLGSQLATWGQELPVRWIKLGEILHQLKESQTVLISREEVIELGKDMEPAIHNEMEITLFLKYEHETGNVIYFDDISEFVILRPQWLIDVLKCLISPRKFQKKRNVFVSDDWKELEQTGRLTDHLFTEVFNSIIVGEKSVLYKEHVLKILEKFDIIVKASCNGDNSAQQTLYTDANPTYINITLGNKNPITGSSVILQNTTYPVHEDQVRASRVLPSDVIVGNIQDSISTPHISSEYTYPRQDIPELRKDGYEVQDEIGQVSCDTSSLQDITSPEITKVHEGGIEVQDEIGQVSRDTSSLQDITSPEITEEQEVDIEVHDEICEVTHETCPLLSIRSQDNVEVQDDVSEVGDDINLVTHATLVEQPTNIPMKGVSEQQKQTLQTLEDMNIHNDSSTRRSTNDGLESGIPNKKTGDNHNNKPRSEHLSFQKQATEFLDYYIPCLIKVRPIKNVQENFKIKGINCQRTSWVCMDFEFLPPAFFNHVLVGYIRRYQISREPSKRGNRLALYRGMGVFNLDTSGCTKLAVCVYGKVIQFQIWDWRENVVKSYKKVWENAVDFIAEIQRRYKIHVAYTIKMKCCDGSYDNPDGMVEVSKLQKDEQYYCDEHATTHNSKDLLDGWFKDELTKECFGQEQYDSSVQAIFKDKIIDDVEICITRHSERLIREVQICGILDYMMSQCAISTEDRNYIEDDPRQTKQNKRLLALIQKRGQVVYDVFIEALSDCQYRDLAELLVLDKEPDTNTTQTGESKESTELQSSVWASKVRLQKNYKVIITSIKHEKIIDHLISKGILTVDDRQIIEANPAQSDKNRKLLEILLQGAQNGLDEFLVALRLDEVYTDLAEQIEKTNVELAEITTFTKL